MNDSDGYVYRYDSWLSHLDLFGSQLRARHWSRISKDSHPHVSLIEAEKSLAAGQGIFRISFWKNIGAALQSIGATYRTSLAVLQRVRDDHPFLASLTREDDDCLKSTAWLYWKIDAHALEQEWSVDGIFLDEVEVLDLDGTWRRFKDAQIMKSAETRLAGQGFRPFYFGDYPSAVYYASRLTLNEKHERQVFVMLYHPPETKGRIYQNDEMLGAFAHSFHGTHAADHSAVRFFIFDDSQATYERVDVGEFEAKPVWIEVPGLRRWFHHLPFIGANGLLRELKYRVDGDRIHWRDAEGDLGQRLVSLFDLPTNKRMIERYALIIDRRLDKTTVSRSDVEFVPI